MKKATILYPLFIVCLGLIPYLGWSQGIISTPADELITVDPSGNSHPDAPNVGISVANPDANLDVECTPVGAAVSNLRFRNLPTSSDTMVLVHDANGYITSRPYSGGGTSNDWHLTGNTITAADFIGTLNNFDMNFRTNNALSMILTRTGDLSVGATNASLGSRNLAVGGGNTTTANSNSNMVSGWTNNVNGGACVVGGQTNTVGMVNGGRADKSVALGLEQQHPKSQSIPHRCR